MNVALVHDYLVEYGGAERVLETLHDMYPQAPVYVAVCNPKGMGVHWSRLKQWDIRVSWFGRIPVLNRLISPFRFLAPLIWESFDLSAYDLVISSSGWFMCKGVLTRPETLHVSYIHHQNKFLTYYETPNDWKKNSLKRIYANIIGPSLRTWDFIGSQRPDIVVANSNETKRRIEKYYRREAQVIYPPVEEPPVTLEEKLKSTKDYYITVSRLTPPKHIDVLIQAANKLAVPLYIVGRGTDEQRLKAMSGPTIMFVGQVPDDKRNELLLGAKAFLFASKDDEFGMAPVEAMMYGVPVIAYASGGVPESVIDEKTGLLVNELSSEAFASAITRFERAAYAPYAKEAYRRARSFSVSKFKSHFVQLVDHALSQKRHR